MKRLQFGHFSVRGTVTSGFKKKKEQFLLQNHSLLRFLLFHHPQSEFHYVLSITTCNQNDILHILFCSVKLLVLSQHLHFFIHLLQAKFHKFFRNINILINHFLYNRFQLVYMPLSLCLY